MGWTFFNVNRSESRSDIIRREFSQEWKPESPTAFGFDSMAERGSTIYAIAWRESPGLPRVYYGMVFLTRRNGEQFGYKDMSEDVGPCYYDAPKRMIRRLETLAPNPTGYAAYWRARTLGRA